MKITKKKVVSETYTIRLSREQAEHILRLTGAVGGGIGPLKNEKLYIDDEDLDAMSMADSLNPKTRDPSKIRQTTTAIYDGLCNALTAENDQCSIP